MAVEVHAMEWRVCPRFPNFEVSEWGDVRRAVTVHGGSMGERLRGFVDADGYRRYKLTDEDGEKHAVTDYKLVAEAFIGPAPSEQHEVAHNNGSRVCAHYSELRWATRRENHGDTFVHETTPFVGVRNPNAKLTEHDVLRLRREYRAIKNRESNKSISDLADEFGIHLSSVSNIARGKTWSHLPLEAA